MTINNEDKLGIALAKEYCPVCLKEIDGAILMNTVLNKNQADKVKELHGKVIGISDTICSECKDAIGDGVYIIIIDSKLTTDINNPFRTGHIFGLKKEAVERMIEPGNEDIITCQYTVMDINIAIEMGLMEYLKD